MIARLFSWLFGCRHRNMSFPQRPRGQNDAPASCCCLTCGATFEYKAPWIN